jgi:hypothetical protein
MTVTPEQSTEQFGEGGEGGSSCRNGTSRSFAGQVPAQAPDSAVRLALMEMIAGILLYACVAGFRPDNFFEIFSCRFRMLMESAKRTLVRVLGISGCTGA